MQRQWLQGCRALFMMQGIAEPFPFDAYVDVDEWT